MQQSQKKSQKIQQRIVFQQTNHHQSLQLNRLVKFIENKKSPSFIKLKHILAKNDHVNTNRQYRNLSNQKDIQKSSNKNNQSIILNKNHQSITFNTKNIFVAKHKTQVTTPKISEIDSQNNYKIFTLKNNYDIFYEGQASESLPTEIKQKIDFSKKSESNRRSNLFPPLIMPKMKKAVVFQKYQDEAARWLNSQILIQQSKSLKKPKQLSYEENNQNKSKKLAIQNLQIQRQRYNKSLQKLIEKALKNKTQYKISNSNRIRIIQGIEGYDSKLIISCQQNNKDSESSYAEKGRLLMNPNLKLKKNIKSRSAKKTTPQKPVTLRNSETQSKQKQILDFEYLENKNKGKAQTNREAYYLQSSLKLRTQVTANSVHYHPSRIKNDTKTAKLIKQLQQSILKSQQINDKKSIKKQNFADLLQRLQNNQNQNTDNNQNKLQKKENRKSNKKTKNIKTQLENHKTLNKWQIAGYDWIQSPEDIQSNFQIQKYVENLAKKTTSHKKPILNDI